MHGKAAGNITGLGIAFHFWSFLFFNFFREGQTGEIKGIQWGPQILASFKLMDYIEYFNNFSQMNYYL